jgi:hypothetical protein
VLRRWCKEEEKKKKKKKKEKEKENEQRTKVRPTSWHPQPFLGTISAHQLPRTSPRNFGSVIARNGPEPRGSLFRWHMFDMVKRELCVVEPLHRESPLPDVFQPVRVRVDPVQG